MSLILSGTDGLSDVDGSAATPAIRGTDANTGIFFGADIIGFAEGGVESMRIDSSGNVGIGYPSPTTKFDVAGTIRSGAGTDQGTQLCLFSDGGGECYAAGFTLNFLTGANNSRTSRMRIDSSGNVGIGTSSPVSGSKIDVNGVVTSSSSGKYLNLGWSGSNAYIQTTDVSSTAYNLIFYGGASERARIDSSGNLLVGLTSQTSTAAVLAVASSKNNGNAARIGLMSIGGISGGAGYPQIGYNTAFTSTGTVNYLSTDTASWIRFNSGKVETFTAASGTSGNAISETTGPYVAQGGTSWTNSSDERLKDIIEPIIDATNKVGQLRAVIGKFKTDPEDKRRSFLLAQDVQSVLPEAVDASDPESLGVQYTDVIPLLVAAIKELKALVDTQASTITQLQADVAALKGASA
jgi:hypothetical protein